MTAKCLCIEQRADSYTGKRGVVHQQVLTLLDISAEHRFLNTFDFVLSPEDIEKLKGASLRDQHVELGITAFEPTFGGRLRARGALISKHTAKA